MTCYVCGTKMNEHIWMKPVDPRGHKNRRWICSECFNKEDIVIDRFDGEYSFLSNFYECSVVDDFGIEYPTVEHAFQAQKTLVEEERRYVSKLPSAGRAKRAGKKLNLRSDWEDVKLRIMYDLLFQKFTKSNELKEKLLATADYTLIEGNTWNDTYWGVCNGIGNNHLGKLLENVRENITIGGRYEKNNDKSANERLDRGANKER